MPARTTLRLGTRGSLLALAQSRIVSRMLRAADPGIDIEIVIIGTRGDRELQVPLTEVTDPGFFCASIDTALREGRIDFSVHSLKDLPLDARPGIRTAAIPRREDPRDVAIFRDDVPDLLYRGAELRIGTSSERRTRLAQAFLREALPQLAANAPRLAFAPLRGAVEQRLARLRLPRSDAAALDGVVLALAGLARLWSDRDGHAAIAPLLAGTRLMVLPLSACPTAPGQGALAVECRADDPVVAQRLATLDHAPTARRVRRELALLATQTEANRNGFGASCVRHRRCGTLLFVGGQKNGQVFTRLLWEKPPQPDHARWWDGAEWVRASDYRAAQRLDLGPAPAVFLAHWRALPPGTKLAPTTRVWVSGVESWRRLAARGQWVEGCADNLGFEAVTTTLATPVLRLPPLAAWTVLTREDATASWRGSGVGRVIASYAIRGPEEAQVLQDIRSSLASATHFFWGSAAQYRALRAWLPAGAHHACGPGKTFEALSADGAVNVQAFPSRREWQRWLA